MKTKALQYEVTELKTQVEALSTELTKALSREEHLKLIVAKYKHMLFGPKSEKRRAGEVLPWLFALPETEDVGEKKVVTEIAAHTRKIKLPKGLSHLTSQGEKSSSTRSQKEQKIPTWSWFLKRSPSVLE